MISDVFFTNQMNRLISAFGEMYYRGEKFVLIKKFVKNLTEDELDGIITHFICSFKFAPLPADFQRAAREAVLSRKYEEVKEIRVIKCLDCTDSGVVRLKYKHDNFKTWGYCDCSMGDQRYSVFFYKLIKYGPEISNFFDKIKWDDEFTKPLLLSEVNQNSAKFNEIVKNFKRSIRKAEDFYKTGEMEIILDY